MKDEILKYVEQYGSVSFAELQKRIEGFTGKFVMTLGPPENNVCFWFGMSKEALDAIEELMKTGKLVMTLSEYLVYFIDGCIPHVPIVRRKLKYKKERWLPVVFYTPEQAKELPIRDKRRLIQFADNNEVIDEITGKKK